MTGSTVLVVRVPRPIEDADACIEHIKRGLRDGILVLGADVKYSVETFPPLGAVEVVAGNVSESGKAAKPPLPDIPAAEGVSRPEPKHAEETNPKSINPLPESEKSPKTDLSNRTVFRAPDDAQKRKASAKRTLPMSAGEIVRSYKQAAKPEEQIGILAELNACSVDEIREILLQLGVELPKAKKRQPGRPKKGSV